MGVKAELAFDVCWEVYRGAREVLEAKRRNVRNGLEGSYQVFMGGRFSSRLGEWVADFALAGQAALRGRSLVQRRWGLWGVVLLDLFMITGCQTIRSVFQSGVRSSG